MVTIVALIPARGNSFRVPHKNIRLLDGHPLIAYSIATAKHSSLFSEVVVCTDDPTIANVATSYGAMLHIRETSTADEPDIAWLRPALVLRHEEAYAILRPTSPFRDVGTLKRAVQTFLGQQPCDSLRAVEPVRQHPGKMWVRQTAYLPAPPGPNAAIGSAFVRERIVPLLDRTRGYTPYIGHHAIDVPWHSSPTQTLPEVYVQNASLEIGWRYNVLPPSLTVAGTYADDGTISGTVVTPFFTSGCEGLDINTDEDFARAERLAEYLPNLETGVCRVVEAQKAAQAQAAVMNAERGFVYTTVANTTTYTCKGGVVV